ncbi:SRPBCC family protein [Streptomyces actinomycinicus]|uniref:SRPBCC family protein n=1 Tax=Streptomyces actinomycinicus TaxID=1695166 RepID=A0A937EM20_9ACTN|nr:SRPBCC family protein [Streptomyces actinomycinicus]MBL1084419.1 SRPBCC family protein [Streptomyces actinomycinicus]
MSVDLTGTYLTLDDGRHAVRFSRIYDHPVDRVWHFVTDPGELAAWFPSRAEADLRPGGTIRFTGDPNMPESTGRVLSVDPPRHLSFTWGDDELHFELEAVGEGRTRFTLTNVLAGTDTAARNGAGWEVCLAALDARARGERPGGPHAGAGAPWREFYDAYIGAGVPSGAPVPGLD